MILQDKEIDTSSNDPRIFQKAVLIDAPGSQVWRWLTVPGLMKQWMMAGVELEILTDWKVGSPLLIAGVMNGKRFENRGIVLHFDPGQRLQYSHLSSISRLPDQPDSYSSVDFHLKPEEKRTLLTVTLSNFPNESIYKHLSFYWGGTLEVLKKLVEAGYIP